jgi:glycosyltransferase involved in cell wall biosynthesis
LVAGHVALVHDYLTQRGGAERVVLTMVDAFPGAPLHTSLYEPATTFPEFRAADVHTLPLNRVGVVRRHHQLALPFLAPSFSRLRVDADVLIASSSGWAHGARTSARKVVFCHTPARWLYQPEQYLREAGVAARAALKALAPSLRRWDRRAAESADLYLANSTAVRDRVLEIYGIEAVVVPPPHAVDPAGPAEPIEALDPGFFLCVSRLKPYKNVDVVMAAFAQLPERRLVVVGTGPDRDRLLERRAANTTLLGEVSDAQLRWLYGNCAGLVAASYEDYGLTPLEAAAFGKPSAVLRWGGFLDTVVEGVTGVGFDQPEPTQVAYAVDDLSRRAWDRAGILAHAESYSEHRFIQRLRGVVGVSSSSDGARREPQ